MKWLVRPLVDALLRDGRPKKRVLALVAGILAVLATQHPELHETLCGSL